MKKFRLPVIALAVLAAPLAPSSAQAVTTLATDNGVIRDQLCVGDNVACPNGVAGTANRDLVLGGNSTGIKFFDTSVGGNPTLDWDIAINDSSANNFWVRNESFVPFKISGGARTNSIVADNQGDIGFGTEDPQTELHSRSGDTPTIRLEQDNSSGFSPETWDIAGNETSFFVRDVTNGSTLPFRIFPGTVSNTVNLRPNGVSVGAGSEALNVADTMLVQDKDKGTTSLRVLDESDTPGTNLDLLALEGKTSAFATFLSGNPVDPANPDFINRKYRLGMAPDGTFQLSTGPIDGGYDPTLVIDQAGTIAQRALNSDRAEQSPADGSQILSQLGALQISKFRNSSDPAGLFHLAPAAPGFNAAFGLGDDKRVAPSDMAAVALVAAKELRSQVEAIDPGGSGVDLTKLQKDVKKATKTAKKAKKTAKSAKKIAKQALKLAKK